MTALVNSVAICNLALTGFLGKPGISSFTQTNVEAQRCGTFYPVALEEIAQATDWSFLRERAALAQVTNTMPDSWDYAYAYPVRALKLFFLFELQRPHEPYKDYKRLGATIFTSLPEAYAHYVTLEATGVTDWPVHFKKALAAKVAELLAPSMTRRASDVNAMRDMAAQELATAIEIDASTEHRSYTEDESYVYGNDGARPSPKTYDGSTFWRS